MLQILNKMIDSLQDSIDENTAEARKVQACDPAWTAHITASMILTDVVRAILVMRKEI